MRGAKASDLLSNAYTSARFAVATANCRSTVFTHLDRPQALFKSVTCVTRCGAALKKRIDIRKSILCIYYDMAGFISISEAEFNSLVTSDGVVFTLKNRVIVRASYAKSVSR